MVKSMAGTPLPAGLVLGTGYAVPCAELVIGVLLLAGVGVRFALVLAFLLMFALMFGIALKQDWNVAGQQLQYGLVLAALLFGRKRYDVAWPRCGAGRSWAARSWAARRGSAEFRSLLPCFGGRSMCGLFPATIVSARDLFSERLS